MNFSDAEDDLEPAIRKTVEENLEHCENPSFSTQNIGLGLACLYFFDQLYPVLHGQWILVPSFRVRNACLPFCFN